MPNVILLNGDAREEDGLASEALTPGELVLEDTTPGNWKANDAAADADATKTWVREQVEDAGAGIDDDIASGDTCTILRPIQGAKIQAFLAHGENVSAGDALESDGAGALQAHSSGRIVAYAAEDLNNTSGSASRIAVTVA